MLPTAPAGPTATHVPVLLVVVSLVVAWFVIVSFVIVRPPPRGPDAPVSGRQDVLTVGLADLVHLGQRHREAVALTGVLREEVLVVLLRTVEGTERLDRR